VSPGYCKPVADTGQRGTLAQTHEGKPGLPRGRSGLPAPEVRASQRERLLRAVIAAVAESGYSAVTVAEIVRRARVSRVAFYAHFAGKEDCFLTATAEGRQLMISRVVAAARERTAGPGDEAILRAACRAYLRFLADEPAFARVFFVDMPAAGPQAVARLAAAARRFADLNRTWHERARERHPDWPVVPAEVYLGLAGATHELVRTLVSEGRTGDLPDLEEPLVCLHLAVLAARPWPRPQTEPSFLLAAGPLPAARPLGLPAVRRCRRDLRPGQAAGQPIQARLLRDLPARGRGGPLLVQQPRPRRGVPAISVVRPCRPVRPPVGDKGPRGGGRPALGRQAPRLVSWPLPRPARGADPVTKTSGNADERA
jgi:AcrR family transcriptional regulator